MHGSSERDSCGIGFVADVRGRASRGILDAALEGLCGGCSTEAPSPETVAPATAPASDADSARARPARGAGWRRSSCATSGARPRSRTRASAEGSTSAAGGASRCAPTRSAPGAGDDADVEQLVLVRPFGVDGDEAERRAYRALRRAQRVEGAYVASLSFRTVVYKALCAADQLAAVYPDLRRPDARGAVRDLPPAFLDEHGAVLGARAAVPVCSATTARSTRSTGTSPRCVREAGRGRRRARPRRLRLGAARQRLRAARARRPGRAPRDADARSARVAERRDAPASERASTTTTPRSSSPGTGRRRSSSRTAASSARRSTGTVCGRCATRSPTTGSSRARPRPARFRSPDGARVRRGTPRSRRRCSSSTRGLGLEEDAEVKRRLASRLPYERWLRRSRRGRSIRASPSSRPEEPLRRAAGARSATRARSSSLLLRATATTAHEATSSMGDDTALPPLAGRARPRLLVLPPALRAGDEPADRPPARAGGDVAADAARRRGAAARLTAPCGTLLELESFFVFPSTRRRARRGAASTRRSTASCAVPASGSPPKPRRRSRAARNCSSSTTRGRAARRSRRCSRSAQCTSALVDAGLRTRALARRRERRAARGAPLRLPARLRRRRDLPAARARDARRAWRPRDKLGGDRPSPREAQLRFRRAIEDGVLEGDVARWASPTSRRTAARSCSTRSVSPARSSTGASRARRRRSAASASSSSSARRSRRGGDAEPRSRTPAT